MTTSPIASPPLDFYFDFSSPYGYLAATQIEALAARHGRTVNWKPILLGAVFKVTGGRPLPSLPLKGDYARRDMARSARFYNIEFRFPSRFPIATQVPARACYWAEARDPALARKLALTLYRGYFVDDLDISNPDVTISIASRMGLPPAELASGLEDSTIKDRLRAEVDAAIHRGVFGSPYVMVSEEAFWGVDRFDQLERWLAQGPF